MSCGCRKIAVNKACDKNKTARSIALKLSQKEKHDYIIYEEENKIHFDRKECWTKAGMPGDVHEVIFYI